MNQLSRAIIPFSFLLGMNFFTGCTDARHTSPAVPAKPAPANPEGTTDGGGGNAIDNRMLESYIIKPEELPATKLHIAKKIATFFGDEKDPAGNMIFQTKTWYLVPSSLKQVSKKALGMEFTDDQTQQVAVQTKDEIWINSNIFNKMTLEDQAKLVLHETMMTFYMVKFLSLQDLCERSERAGRACNSSSMDIKKMEEVFKPEAERSLIAQDYNAIRSMTNWVWNASDTLKKTDFYRVAQAAGFDKRFSTEDDVNKSETKISGKKFQLLLDQARYGNTLAKICTGLQSKKSYPCELSWSYFENAYNSIGVNLKVKELVTNTVIVDMKATIPGENIVSHNNYINGHESAYAALMSNDLYYLQNGQVAPAGTQGYWIEVIMNSDVNELEGVAFILLVNSGTYEEEKEVKNDDGTTEKEICKTIGVTKRKGTSLYEEPFVVGNSASALNQALVMDLAKFNGTKSCAKQSH